MTVLTAQEKADLRARARAGDALARQFLDQEDSLNDLQRMLLNLRQQTGSGGVVTDGNVSGTYTCDASLAVKDVVFFSAPLTVEKADATQVTTVPAIGMVASKPTPTSAVVRLFGEVTGLTGLTIGTYYLSLTPGQITQTVPAGAGQVVQKVGFAKSSTIFVVTATQDFLVN